MNVRQKVKLYHASTVRVEQPDTQHSRPNLDFGCGFYLTALRSQAESYAERFKRRGKSAILNEYELDQDMPGFELKRFDTYDEEWLDYVATCRKGLTPPQRYDAVEGGVANDKVFNTVDLYFAGIITKQEALGRLCHERPNHQICLLSDALIARHLHFIKAEEI